MLKNLETKLVIISIQIALAYIWLLAAWPKLFDSSYAAGFEQKFAGSFLAAMPGGMQAQVYLLGILELAAGALALISLLKLEFHGRSLIWLRRCLGVSALTFCALGFGLAVVADHAGKASIFFYLSGIVVAYVFTSVAVRDF